MNISQLLTPDLVVPALDASDKDSVLRALAARVVRCRSDVDEGELVEALRQRERLSTTALADGIAVPHAKLPGLDGMVAALGRSIPGVHFDAHDGTRTHLFFLLIAPSDRPGDHLKTLAAVSRLLHDPRRRTELMEAADEAAMLRALGDHTLRAA